MAVHISYESRAAERGRRPQAPSYFLKPTSSLSSSGAPAVRPAGTELLGFEGEVALIIGAPARQVPLERAWDHVGWITASDDLGLYDLRSNDKGSNLRNKGRDGYTPVGPQLIDARAVDPNSLRVRTWRNGELVQEDTTAAMIFPLVQIVADLSQHLTLQPGDLILTGTPAGASVAVPGDVIEVEVDAPAAEGSPSTGRLVTHIVEGEGSFDPALGSGPSVDDHQREEAWGSREAAGLPPQPSAAEQASEPASEQASEPAPARTLSPALREKLEEVPVAGLAQELRKRGLNNVVIDGVRPQRPGTKLVGTAKTLRFVPNREDLFKTHGGGFNAQKRAFDSVGEGEVLIIEARGETGSGTLGDILALRAQARGAAGVVTDGGVRDDAAVAEIGLPVFSNGAHPAVLGRKHVPWDVDVAVACGGAAVLPGDIIVGDDDGVLVLPPDIAEEVVEAALTKESEDAWVAARVAEGHPVDGLFPMNAEWRARYEQERGRDG
ncbi:MAG: fumarylacetoacetate hydrolase family protein [Nesterenkonia sp.]|nr:fumarylacetoacetate hydrolase family protein [Nesterenkonia sp.]